ncbi:Gfo/Idh/MocA family protein [Humibacter ginsenosidimutans]|uniref:Gfo/Idh/MocA family oxidoreductase n=1 Tax=Humibacter ginsenosidimutans TaxID=2599293 RepID=A0A5B8M3V9_9MICO|nr:Gfo/Idh/MocA family oxidoreductase [Humibacter ginsenosidimutans]QDZ14851.1 Gfo/Idh/MocA family oxidoreductase [Humibacter ginsenosidimutans]
MSAETRLRVAVLSFWHVHADDYAKTTVQHPDTELVAVWDDDEERGRAGAARFGVDFEPDLDALLARDDIDAVTVTTSTKDHRDIMVKAARAGKHIFTEKLLAPTVAEAEEIIGTCDENGVKLIVSLPRLYHGYTQVVKEVLASGSLGTVNYSRVRLSHDGAVVGWLPEQFYDADITFGLALADLGCHPVYLTQLFLGSRPATIASTYTHVTGREVEDNAVVTVTYDGGAIGVIEAGVVSPDPFLIEIGGASGWLSYAEHDEHVRVAVKGEKTRLIPVPDDQPSAFDQWVAHIQHGTRADDNLARAVELTRLVVAANNAAISTKTEDYS